MAKNLDYILLNPTYTKDFYFIFKTGPKLFHKSHEFVKWLNVFWYQIYKLRLELWTDLNIRKLALTFTYTSGQYIKIIQNNVVFKFG